MSDWKIVIANDIFNKMNGDSLSKKEFCEDMIDKINLKFKGDKIVYLPYIRQFVDEQININKLKPIYMAIMVIFLIVVIFKL